MKMTKKILVGAVAAVAMAFSFTGCDILGGIMRGDKSLSDVFMKEYGTEKVIEYSDNDGNSNGIFKMIDNVKEEGDKVDGYTNSTEEMVRAMKFQQLKHHGIDGIVTLKPNGTKSTDGVMGVVFGAAVNEDEEGNELDTMNFGLVGVRVAEGKVGFYVSYFANIKSEDLGKSNFNAKDDTKTKVDPKVTTPYEIRFEPKSGDAYKLLNGLSLDENGEVKVYLEVVEDKETGDYTVNLYKVAKAAKDGDAIASVAVPASALNREYSKTVCGCYANVYAGKTLTASFELM